MSSIGYARVSTADQDTAAQTDALTAAGCDRIFTETATGADPDRAQLAACLDYLREGDTLVVWRLDRLGRSLPHLLRVVEQLTARGIHLRSLTESLDTSSASGRLIISVFGALAEFERDLIRERTLAGLAAARARGAKPGRPAALTSEQVDAARQLLATGASAASVARTLGVGRSTLYRHLGTNPG